MNPLISVILPIYNMEDYLARCLDSILANAYDELEIICVDDGSKDNSFQILQQYAKKDARIVVIRKENGGVSSARNAGLTRVTGDFVTFIDPDDFVHFQYFEQFVATQREYGSDLVICRYVCVEEKELPIQMDRMLFDASNCTPVDKVGLFKRHDLGAYCWGRFFRASLLRGLAFREDISYGEDTIFNAEVWTQNQNLRAIILNKRMYYYFQRAGSLITSSGIEEQAKAAFFFAEKACSGVDDAAFLDRAIKSCLDKRYLSTHILINKNVSSKCGGYLKRLKLHARKSNIYSLKEKLPLLFFIVVPLAYWAYRSLTQPHMWRWEKVQRRKRREEKKQKRRSPL